VFSLSVLCRAFFKPRAFVLWYMTLEATKCVELFGRFLPMCFVIYIYLIFCVLCLNSLSPCHTEAVYLLPRPRFDNASVRVRLWRRTGTRTGFALSTPVSPVTIIPPLIHTHSFIYQRRCIMLFSQYFSFPCQYHSTIAPYSFIHLPPTLYNVFLPVLQVPLSLSFHHCSILIHLPPTLYNVFLPVLQFPLSVSFHHCSILIHSSTTDAV
jgi:hypothetical protein